MFGYALAFVLGFLLGQKNLEEPALSKRALLKFIPVLCVESRGRQRLRARIWANVGFRAGVSVGLWLEFRLGVGFMHWLGLVLGLC